MPGLGGLMGMDPRSLGRPRLAAKWFSFGVWNGTNLNKRPWVCPETGVWRFVLWGGGSSAYSVNRGGASGAFYMGDRQLRGGDVVMVNPGAGSFQGAGASPSVVTLPSGEVISCPGGVSGDSTQKPAPPLNQPTDFSLPPTLPALSDSTQGFPGAGNYGGLAGSATYSAGSGAPGWYPYRGGNGGDGMNGSTGGRVPGGGGTYSGVTIGNGGDGLILIHPVKL